MPVIQNNMRKSKKHRRILLYPAYGSSSTHFLSVKRGASSMVLFAIEGKLGRDSAIDVSLLCPWEDPYAQFVGSALCRPV